MFNAAADAVISAAGLRSVDLYAATPRDLLKPDGVHFYAAGSLVLAEMTAEALRAELANLLPPVRMPGPSAAALLCGFVVAALFVYRKSVP